MIKDSLGVVLGAVLLIALVAAVAVLTWHGTIDGQAAMTFFAGIAGLGGGAGVGHVATKTGARAAKLDGRDL